MFVTKPLSLTSSEIPRLSLTRLVYNWLTFNVSGKPVSHEESKFSVQTFQSCWCRHNHNKISDKTKNIFTTAAIDESQHNTETSKHWRATVLNFTDIYYIEQCCYFKTKRKKENIIPLKLSHMVLLDVHLLTRQTAFVSLNNINQMLQQTINITN